MCNYRFNETAPELKRFMLATLMPPPLQPPVAGLLDRLPASVCSLPPASIAGLPLAFKHQACPVANVLQMLKGEAKGLHSSSWVFSLAEVTMGPAGNGDIDTNNSSAAAGSKAEAWLLRMCRCVGAPWEIAANSPLCKAWRHCMGPLHGMDCHLVAEASS